MRLVFFTSCGFPWGGSEELWSSTARRALEEGHDVLVSVFDWPQLHPRIQELREKGAQLHLRRRFYPHALRRLQKKLLNLCLRQGGKFTYHAYINAFQPTHIFFSLAGGDEIALDSGDLMVFIRQTKVPFTVMYHSVTPGYVYPPGLAANMREVFRRSSWNLFSSKMQMQLYGEQLSYDLPKSRIVHHPLRQLQSAPFPDIASGAVRMCMVGSLIKRWKGQDIVLEVLSSPEWLERSWVLDIYGNGPDAEALQVFCNTNGLQERVHFKGFVEDIDAILASHHIVLIPSRQDTGPIILFEAMQAARPVVGTPMGAIPEHLQDGVNGFLADRLSTEGFSDALERCWQSRNTWEEIGQRARAHINATYDPQPERTLLELITQ